MGGCATKPKVSKDDVTAAPEPQPEPKQHHVKKENTVQTKVKDKQQHNVDDDQSTKQRSLSLLFNKENDEDAKVSTKAEETVKQETLEAEKPLADTKSSEPKLKHESPKTDEKPSQEITKNNEPTTKQEPAVIVDAVKHEIIEAEKPFEDAITNEPTTKQESAKIEKKLSKEIEPASKEETPAVFVDAEEKPSLQIQSTAPATEVTVKIETSEEAKKTSEETAAKQNQNSNVAKITEENEGAKVSTENVKTIAEETVKQDTIEAEKPFVDAISNEPMVKQESSKIEEKLSEEIKNNEPATKQEPAVFVDAVKQAIIEAEKPFVDAISNEPTIEEKLSEKTKNNEPTTKQEPAVVVDAVKEKIIEAEKPFEDAITNEPLMKQESAKIEEKLSKETKNNEPATKQEPAAVFVDALKQEIIGAEKPFEDAITNKPLMKQESAKIEDKLSKETKNNEPATKQETAAMFVDAEEKPLQNQSIVPAEEIVKTEATKEAKKTSEETKINEPAVENLVKQNQNAIAAEVAVNPVMKTEKSEVEKASKGTQSNELNEVNEPIKQEKLSEIQPVDDVVISPPKAKVTEVVLTKNADSAENKAVKEISKASE